MFSFLRAAAAIAVTLSLSSGGRALSAIARDGRYLYDNTGERFYIMGAAYQEQGESSPADVGL